MHSRLFGPKFIVYLTVTVFILLCVEFVQAQRLNQRLTETRTRTRTSSRFSIFNRFLSPLRNFIDEITYRPSRSYEPVFYPPETFLSTPEIIRLHGYRVEEHKLETRDGYIISIFRILHSKKDDKNDNELRSRENLEPVLILHGLISSSDDFLQLDPKDILPYLLADSGHKVWLGNFRGNTYGKTHVKNISASDPEFYDFTIDDAARDIPEMIKYVLEVENAPQLSYVCHSLGCNLISMAVSEDPGLNKMIKKATFMAPGMYISHLTSPAALAITYTPEPLLLAFSQRYAGGRMIPPGQSVFLRKYAPALCLREDTRHFCTSAVSFLNRLNPGQIENNTLVKMFGHFPADTSVKLFIQYAQYFKTGNFQKFDFGREKNLEVYGTDKPPLYNLSRVTFPVQGFYSLNDNLASPKDVERSWSELGNMVQTNQMDGETWTHFDFLYGKDARKLIYDKIVKFLA